MCLPNGYSGPRGFLSSFFDKQNFKIRSPSGDNEPQEQRSNNLDSSLSPICGSILFEEREQRKPFGARYTQMIP